VKPVRILVADDHDVVRQGLRALLETQKSWQVCAEAATGREAVERARREKPDVVVLDITMPELNGLEAARQILQALPHTEIVILTMHESEEMARQVLAVGVHGYVLKSDAARELVAAVEALAEHKPYFTTRVSQMVLEGYLKSEASGPAALPRFRRLTAREREVVQLLAEGKSNKEVAARLGISVKTAETHRGNIMRKLNLHSVAELVHYAVRNQIVQP
jgi:DNA-binding NarL/FixJ family response regulator